MLIKFLATGKVTHVENSVGRGFILGGAAEEVTEQAQKRGPIREQWSVCFDGGGFVCIKLELGVIKAGIQVAKYNLLDPSSPTGTSFQTNLNSLPVSVQYYHGDPDTIHDRKQWNGNPYCSAFGRLVPDSVIAEYRAARLANPRACAPIMPNRSPRNDNAAAAKTFQRNVYTPVVSEREALAAEEQAR